MTNKEYKFEDLPSAPLIPGFNYLSGNSKTISDDIFNSLLGTGNSAGMRSKMSSNHHQAFMVIISNPSAKSYYPDQYNIANSTLLYWGDQRKENISWKETKQKGNIKVWNLFKDVSHNDFSNVFPIFYFKKSEPGRSHKYIGMAFPYLAYTDSKHDIVLERTLFNVNNLRFEFVIDNTSCISREWISNLLNGEFKTEHAPKPWLDFINGNLTNFFDSKQEFKVAEPSQTEVETANINRIIATRTGQTKLRKELLSKYDACQLCGLTYQQLLIASHIIPWKDSDLDNIVKVVGNNSRGNIDNVLLLCANHDKLFDNHLISFDKNGSLMISKSIKDTDYKKLMLSKKDHITMNSNQAKYMKEHRNIFITLERELTAKSEYIM